MKPLKLILLAVLLLFVGIFAGCKAECAPRHSVEPVKIYHQRADGLHIPTDSYPPLK